MQIDRIFNETEITLFFRQTGFTFGECFRTTDGSICAVGRQSGQIFIGTDLLRNNVHSLGSVVSAEIVSSAGEGCSAAFLMNLSLFLQFL